MSNPRKLNSRSRFLLCVGAFALVLTVLAVATAVGGRPGKAPEAVQATEVTEAPSVKPSTHMIQNVKVIPQEVLKAGCETYACTILLQHLGYDIDEYRFSEQYLFTRPISYDEYGTRYGPDMYSAQAGDVYTGYGVYNTAMAKSMNAYLDTTDKNQKAYPLEGVPLAQLCEEYIDNDIPVMVWATTWMMEPYDKGFWVVDYVDENARTKVGDTFAWKQNEHCLVLIGYEEKEYYFADSCEGGVSHFKKELCQQRYEEIGTMAIVVK